MAGYLFNLESRAERPEPHLFVSLNQGCSRGGIIHSRHARLTHFEAGPRTTAPHHAMTTRRDGGVGDGRGRTGLHSLSNGTAARYPVERDLFLLLLLPKGVPESFADGSPHQSQEAPTKFKK